MTREYSLSRITESLDSSFPNINNIGLHAGLSGIGLYYYYYGNTLNNNINIEKGRIIFKRIVALINQGNLNPSLCNGIAGFCWTIQHILSNKLEESDEFEDLLDSFDEYLYRQMYLGLENHLYDFLHGPSGICLYFLERYKIKKSDYYKGILNGYITRLFDIAEREGDWVFWKSSEDPSLKAHSINLGMAHGQSSIVSILSKLNSLNISDNIPNFLKSSTDFILNQRSTSHSSFSQFPNYLQPGITTTYDSRLAWCYGDLTIATSLVQSGMSLKNESFTKAGLDIIKVTSDRRSPRDSMIFEPGLCHGAFGVALIFRYLQRIFPSEISNEIIVFWTETGHEMLKKSEYLAKGLQTQIQFSEHSLLEGLAGIGLAILDGITSPKHYWGQSLLLG